MRDSYEQLHEPKALAPHLYLHVPFCARRCSYCDFAIAVRSAIPIDAYVAGIAREMATRFPAGASLRTPLRTVYLGGGTPSRLGGPGVARALDVVRRHWEIAPNAEVTVEANPEDVTAESVPQWREAGVNRVSLGVQSFDDRVLQWMHRTHDARAVSRAAELLAAHGIVDWSLDLIYALPAEVERDWSADLGKAVALGPPHLSLYGLTVEPATPLARWRDRGAVHESPEERYESDFLTAHAFLVESGYHHYEVSNYARPGSRARHNSAYWSGAAYVGIGPSAHGYDGVFRRWNERNYAAWLVRVQAGEDPVEGSERLTSGDRLAESLYVALRTDAGVEVTAADAPIIDSWLAAGWGTVREGVMRLTPLGWLRLDALSVALTVHRSRF